MVIDITDLGNKEYIGYMRGVLNVVNKQDVNRLLLTKTTNNLRAKIKSLEIAPLTNTTELRQKVTKAYSVLIERIKAHATLTKAEAYYNILNEINMLYKQYIRVST